MVCSRAEDAASAISTDAKQAPDWRRKEPEDERGMEKSEWRIAPIYGPMPGHEIGPHGDDPRARGGRDLYLWTGRHVRVSRSSGNRLSTLRDPHEPHKRVGWNNTQLVPARCAEGTDEQHGALWEGERSRVGSVQFPRTTAMPDGRQT